MTEQQTNEPAPGGEPVPAHIALPAPTAWPMVLALGAALVAGGLVTDIVFTALGGLLLVIGLGGWVGQLLPGRGEVEEALAPAEERPRQVRPTGAPVARLAPGMPGARFQVPEKIHPYSAGAKGGLLGGIAMAIIAEIWGLISGNGLWYPVNLLAGAVLPWMENQSAEQLRQRHFGLLVLGIALHAIGSVGNGLLCGVLLPMLPRYPVFWSGVVAPLLWTGFVWGFMGVLNPTLDRHVNWPWFIASQFAYGLVLGYVVKRSEKIPVEEYGGSPTPPTGGEGRS